MAEEDAKKVEEILFHGRRRFTQDTPVLPEVWLEFARLKGTKRNQRVEVLITPRDGSDISGIASHLKLPKGGFAHIANFAAVRVTFRELITQLLPLTQLKVPMDHPVLAQIAAVWGFKLKSAPVSKKDVDLIWQIALNRPVTLALKDSVATTKADAATRVFDIKCSEIGWAVVDNGVDATHPVFKKDGSHRIKRYDLTDIQKKLSDKLQNNAYQGKLLDWSFIEKELEREEDAHSGAHGTHVAGIIGGDWKPVRMEGESDEDFKEREDKFSSGLCPDINIYDIKVFDEKNESREFTILAALQFIRYLNNKVDVPVINGANLSFSIAHKVTDFACGATPVCKECDRLVASGVVVVAAAGNYGYKSKQDESSYSDISITDPGNAESVITVGATHRQMPHTYGVSYFSSRGPTGDGRLKPDLVAPGEKITSATPNEGTEVMDGTSMAVPHVSGVAALLMAKYPEFRGKPQRVKEILMNTATDLKRERYFQGAGLVDAMRALQSV